MAGKDMVASWGLYQDVLLVEGLDPFVHSLKLLIVPKQPARMKS